VVVDNANDIFFGRFLAEGGGKVRVGSQDSGFPTIAAPSGQTAFEDVEQVVDGISIVDAGDAELTFTLDVSQGKLSLGTIPVTLNVDGNGTGSLTLTGTCADINAALDSLVDVADLNYSGGDTLALALTDAFLSGYETSEAINVVSAAEQATSLQALVSSLQTTDVLNEGQANSLIVKLNLEGDAGDIDQVQDFLNEVAAFRRARILTQDQADELSYWGNIYYRFMVRATCSTATVPTNPAGARDILPESHNVWDHSGTAGRGAVLGRGNRSARRLNFRRGASQREVRTPSQMPPPVERSNPHSP
jgi:hypothetical protein